MQNLSGKVALVTGGASGIGLGIVKAFLEQNMKVMIADVRQDHLINVKKLFAGNPDVDTLQLDVMDRQAMADAARTIEQRFSKLHVLCNNAGVAPLSSVEDCSNDDWDWCIGVNLTGIFNGIRAFLPLLKKHGEGGHIVNTSSVAAVVPMGLAYAASKCGVMGITEGSAVELAALGIGTTCLLPGPVRSNIHEVAKLRPARFSQTGNAEVEAQLAQREAPEHWLDPLVVGRMVVDAINRNLLYVITHNEFREGIEKRCQAILAAIPTGTATPEEKARIGFPVENPIYDRLIDLAPAQAVTKKSQLT